MSEMTQKMMSEMQEKREAFIKEMLTKKNAIKIVIEFIDACAEKNILFSKVILFGSLVSGKNHKYSDIDVALVSKKFNEMPFRNWSLLTPVKIKSKKFFSIEPHPYSEKYFNEGDPFIDEIKKTGIEIKRMGYKITDSK